MSLSRAKVTRFDPQTGYGDIKLHTTGRGQEISNLSFPQPFLGRGWGILTGVETDTLVTVEQTPHDTHIIGYEVNTEFYEATRSISDSLALTPTYKELREGEIALQSRSNSLVFLNEVGNIELSTSDGNLFEVNKETDTINQISLSNITITEAARLRNGLIKRDVRTDLEKEADLFVNQLLSVDTSKDLSLDIVGADSEHELEDLTGTFDPTESDPSILVVPGIQGTPNADKIVTGANPALVEYRLDVAEFADGLSGLSFTADEETREQGRLSPNTAAILALGNVVNEGGVMPRFDYVFGNGTPKGHGRLWELPAVNEIHNSVDFKTDLNRRVTDAIANGSETEWVSAGINRFNTALMFDLVLNTRGADHEGNIPDGTNIGSKWALRVDKEGMTKWNIPAATNLDGLEQFRAGRSLLWNMDGSLSMSVGKEQSADLKSIGHTDVSLLKTRKDRSWTADFEGSIEWVVGADALGQSRILEADGSYAFKYGLNKSTEASVVSSIDTAGLTAPSVGGKRTGNSVSGILEGSAEFQIGVNDSANRQSIAMNADGLVSMTLGTDKVKDSLKIEAAGNIKMKVANGGHKFEMTAFDSPGAFKNGIMLQHGGTNQSLFQIDADGVITIRNSLINSNIIISAEGAISLVNLLGKISLGKDGVIGLGGASAGIDIDPVNGVIIRTSGGSMSLDLLGKIEMACNAGLTVTGSFAHLNTTATALGPGAATGPFNIAAFGPGSIDPFTGNPCSVSGFSTLKGG